MTHNMIRSPARMRDFKSEGVQHHAAFEAEFGEGREVAVAIRKCLIEAHKRLVVIAGKEAADAAFDALVARVSGAEVPQAMWRRRLHEMEAETCTRMAVGKAFRDLAAYARYGILLDGGIDPRERFNLLTSARRQACLLEMLTTTSFEGTELEKILLQAEARLALDRGELIDVRSLAALGNVDESVVRGCIADGELPCIRGRVPAGPALCWLKAQAVPFRDSVWQAQEPLQDQALAA